MSLSFRFKRYFFHVYAHPVPIGNGMDLAWLGVCVILGAYTCVWDQDRDKDASYSWGDILAYRLENAIAANSNVRFYVLIFVFVVGVVSTAVAWALLYRVSSYMNGEEFQRNEC